MVNEQLVSSALASMVGHPPPLQLIDDHSIMSTYDVGKGDDSRYDEITITCLQAKKIN